MQSLILKIITKNKSILTHTCVWGFQNIYIYKIIALVQNVSYSIHVKISWG